MSLEKYRIKSDGRREEANFSALFYAVKNNKALN